MTQRSERMLSELDFGAQPVFRKFIEMLDERLGDDKYIIFEGRRRLPVQEAYYAQGRENLEAVNKKRAAAGLFLLRTERDNYIITWTLDSMHLKGMAMDVIPVDGGGNPTWDTGHFGKVFDTIVGCGRQTGLICGADWQQKDIPHYEVRR